MATFLNFPYNLIVVVFLLRSGQQMVQKFCMDCKLLEKTTVESGKRFHLKKKTLHLQNNFLSNKMGR